VTAPTSLAVIGAGSWGTALAVHLGRQGHHVQLWARDPKLAEAMARSRQNHSYLDGITLPLTVHPTADARVALDGAGTVVWAVPSHGTRASLRSLAGLIAPATLLVSATKGLEPGTWARMSDVLAEEVPDGCPVVALSGPSFAREVACDLPTAVCAAGTDAAAVQRVLGQFRGKRFRLYASDDVIGVEMGGACKNVIAIAAGVVQGLGLGHNAMAGLVTRGLAEMTRLAVALGGRRDTLSGLSGLGDLVLTCTSGESRNQRVGRALGEGQTLAEILGGMRMVAEGIHSADGVLALGARVGVELPIAQQMADVLAGRTDPLAAAESLMLRPQRQERH